MIDNAAAVVRVSTEGAHKSKRADRGTYKTTRRETVQFILAVIEDTWVQELREPETFYTDITPEALLYHLQAGCTGRHALDLLALHIEMERYHLEVEGIPEYINMLEDAQKKQGGPAKKSRKKILLFESTEMLTTERYPRAKNYWEDRSEDEKTWANWKTNYKKAHAKARVKAQAANGDDKLVAANTANQFLWVGFNKNSTRCS